MTDSLNSKGLMEFIKYNCGRRLKLCIDFFVFSFSSLSWEAAAVLEDNNVSSNAFYNCKFYWMLNLPSSFPHVMLLLRPRGKRVYLVLVLRVS